MTITTAPALATRDEYADAIGTAIRAAAAYYGSGESPLDDASFDLLVSLIQAYEERYPEHVDPATGKAAASAVAAGHARLVRGAGEVLQTTGQFERPMQYAPRTGLVPSPTGAKARPSRMPGRSSTPETGRSPA
ncbi:hypothetical protein ABZ128_04820 [Streptomyces sp. NPDC006326]|uniref:hypothetical protein n=1 Tax=Streptomyces sp. NPDC006326 TaxID=3156752 RepID=UPI0033A55E74